MPHPYQHAQTHPERPACIMAESGKTLTYRELDARSNQIAHLLRARGLKRGDGIALFMENTPEFLEIVWGAQRAGLYFTPVSWRLTAGEAAYIIKDCEAQVVFASHAFAATARGIAKELGDKMDYIAVGGEIDGYKPYDAERDQHPEAPISDESPGTSMLYSSGTTGRPKGIRRPLHEGKIDEPEGILAVLSLIYEMDGETRYLSPAPLYHAAPLAFTMGMQYIGGTVVIMEHFNEIESLRAIETHKITHSQWVPTMFVKMLKMPEEERTRFDLSTHRCAIHAAAPCPIAVKHAMIDWWGEIINEYYAGSEGNGFCVIDSKEWLAHEGSVGRAVVGTLHICDDEGNELKPGEEGLIYYESENTFEYYKDPEKTKDSRHPAREGWTTLGDIGKMDAEGFLYLTDRRAYMIISGGVNIYPQETENILIMHPKVADCAVIGVPHEEFGEAVKAVVQPADFSQAGAALGDELMAYCREHLSALKCPRSVDFERELPRHPTGKLYKRLLRDRYWSGRESKIV